jgi:beta-phosphoglucomutase
MNFGVIFDMDGVIADSTKLDFLSWKKIFSDKNCEFDYRIYKSFLGMHGFELTKKHLTKDESEAKILADKKEDYFLELLSEDSAFKPISGVETLLSMLKSAGIKTAVASAGPRKKVMGIVDRLGFHKYFSAFVTADDVSRGKPFPDTFLKAAEKLGIRPNNCVVIEDAPNGVNAAKAAGMACMAITTTHQRSELAAASVIIDSYKEVSLDLIEKLLDKKTPDFPRLI